MGTRSQVWEHRLPSKRVFCGFLFGIGLDNLDTRSDIRAVFRIF